MKVFVTGANGQLGHDVVTSWWLEVMKPLPLAAGKNTSGYRMVRLSVVHPIVQWIFVSGRMYDRY